MTVDIYAEYTLNRENVLLRKLRMLSNNPDYRNTFCPYVATETAGKGISLFGITIAFRDALFYSYRTLCNNDFFDLVVVLFRLVSEACLSSVFGFKDRHAAYLNREFMGWLQSID